MLTRILRSHRATRASSDRGFTLLELIVTIVILGLLAALAVPALRAVVDRSHDRVAVIELQGIHREVAALAALTGGVITEGMLADATAGSNLSAAGPLAQSGPQMTLVEGDPSYDYGTVSWAVVDGQLALAMVSRAGNCAGLIGSVTTHVAGMMDVDVAAGECAADPDADLGETTGPGGGGPGGGGESPTDIPLTDPLPPEFIVLPGDPVTTIDEPGPDLNEPEIDEDTGPTGAFAMTSFPSTHTNFPHHLYTTFPDAGLVVQVSDHGGASGTLRAAASTFDRPTGIASGPTTSDPNRYSVLYVADATAGTITSWNPTSGATSTVVSGLNNPGNIVGFACYDATGTRTSGVCLYVATDDGLVQVNVGTQSVVRTVSSDAFISGDSGLSVSGNGIVVSDGTGTARTVSMSGATAPLAGSHGALAGLDWDGSLARVLAADTGANQVLAIRTSDGNSSVITGDIDAPTVAHFHGNAGTAYAANLDCIYRVTSGSATPLWCATPVALTGGTVVQFGAYTLHVFSATDTVTVTSPGAVDLLVVGGGGSGGRQNTTYAAGGGGAGGLHLIEGMFLPAGAHPVVVGAGGGETGSTVGQDGGASSLLDVVAAGGGGGGGGPGRAGGSGGGGWSSGSGWTHVPGTGGAGIDGQGHAGGTGYYGGTTPTSFAGGGGGAGEPGKDGNDAAGVRMNGGVGLDLSAMFGTAVGDAGWFAGGGGGYRGSPNVSLPATFGAGGQGGGANGGTNSGQANTGGGGGGTWVSGARGHGGSGVVILRYLTPTP